LPAGVSLQVWSDFLKNRQRKRLPNTDTAWKAFNDDLTRVTANTGLPPAELIEHAAAKGWGGIYEPNISTADDRRGSTDPPKFSQVLLEERRKREATG
jgi:hypothetical protein